MTGPTNNVSATAAALMARPRPSRVVGFPGNDSIRVRLMVPSDLDKAEAGMAGELLVRQQFVKLHKREPTADDLHSPASQAAIGDQSARELLARCCFEEQEIGLCQYPRMFPNGGFISQACTAEEVAILFFELNIVEQELGPRTHVLLSDPTILRMWVDKLKEKAWSAAPLSSLAWLDLAELCRSCLIRISELESTAGEVTPEEEDSQPPSSASSGESSQESCVEPTTSSGASPETSILTGSEVMDPASVLKAASELVKRRPITK